MFHVTTKIHLLVNAAGLPMRSEITPGQPSDDLGFDLVMADNLPTPNVLLADRGYDADSIRETMNKRDVLPVIPLPGHRLSMPCRGRDAQIPQKAHRRGPFTLQATQPGRTALQQIEQTPPCRPPLRRDRIGLPRFR
ncbi:MAG: transposase [Rhodobacteraceae bacterium]|nr:transposase [Paracoccaceae bacterium]